MHSRILYVDDENEWRRMVGTFLRLAGYDLLLAKDASEALQLAEEPSLGAIILDVNLAGEDGATLMRYLTTNRPELPIILYTGLDHDDETIQRMLKHGARHYLKKGNLQHLVDFVGTLSDKFKRANRRSRQAVNTGGWQIV